MKSQKQSFFHGATIRKLRNKGFAVTCGVCAAIGICTLIFLLSKTIIQALPWLDWQFLTSAPSRFAEKAGIYPLIVGSFFLIVIVILLSVPLGISAAIYLEEYAPKNILTRIIEANISNLSGVPSIVFGLLGLGLFINMLGLKPGIIIVAAATLTLRILPIIIISTQETIRAVPHAYRDAAYALGASRWETIRTIILPESMRGIMTGVIIAVSNAMGETAPLIMIGVATSIFSVPRGIMSAFGALPLQIYAWSDYPKEEFQNGITSAAIVVLLGMLIILNICAVFIRKKYNAKRY